MNHSTPVNPKDRPAAAGFRVYYFLLALLFVLLCIMPALTVRSIRMTRDELMERQINVTYQIKNNLEYRFLQQSELAKSIMLLVSEALNTRNVSEAQDYTEFVDISNQLIAYQNRGMISDILLYVPDRKFYSRQHDLFFPLSELSDDPVYIQSTTAGIHWIPWASVSALGAVPRPAVACTYSINSRQDFETLAGTLILLIATDDIDSVISSGASDNDEVFLVDANGVTVAHSDVTCIGTVQLSEKELDLLHSTENGGQFLGTTLFCCSYLNAQEWYVVSRTATDAVGWVGNNGTTLLIFLWIATLLAIGVIITTLTHNVVIGDAVRTIQSMLQDADTPNMESDGVTRRQRFVGNAKLQAELTRTIDIISKNIKMQYEEKLALADYQMQSLQEQIKPHFLYNTLDVIKWMIIERNYTDGIWTINALSRYLRMSINRDSSIVALREEIELTRTYLGIIQKRFAGSYFKTVFDLEDASLELELPRLILQPIVENALIHSLLYCEKNDARLEIRSWVEPGCLCIDIEDNGTGMTAEQVEALNADSLPANNNYGIRNIRKRLTLFGGQSASLHFYSQSGLGTCVSIRIPVQSVD